MSKAEYNIGIAGVSTMGASLAQNIAGHGYSVAAYDTNQIALGALQIDTQGRSIEATNSLAEFVSLLDVPRTVMILVPAGRSEDRLINALLPHLTSGDLVIDATNPYFKDTDARAKVLAESGIELLGVGISGGERGVSIMAGGPRRAYDRVRQVFESIAAEVNGEPCVAYLGPRSAGHYVEMVHDGIERGVMQLIAETYDLMSRGLGMSDVA
ncbi:MAG TPA: NAD(P)-binding domain-containing protein, partial [Blastocatellia bacterium]|nr:NAD(P)-binding domain-containing protein [Blastocatellia bacterium]